MNSSNSTHHTSYLVSGSGDGSLCVWKIETKTDDTLAQHSTALNSNYVWTATETLDAHSGPITSISVLATTPTPSNNHSSCVMIATSGDGDVTVWAYTSSSSSSYNEGDTRSSWSLQQRVSFGTRLQQCSALSTLPMHPSTLVLALGGVDAKVRLFLSSPPETRSKEESHQQQQKRNYLHFAQVCELAGHQNWIRGVAFKASTQGSISKLLLVSASQDRNIRLWAIAPLHDDAVDPGTNSVTGHSPSAAALAIALTRYAPKPKFHVGRDAIYEVVSEALLVGHEDWVHSVSWKPQQISKDSQQEESHSPCLLSSSMDRTMMIWMQDAATGTSFEVYYS